MRESFSSSTSQKTENLELPRRNARDAGDLARTLTNTIFTCAGIVSEKLRRKSDSKNTTNMSQDIVADGLNCIMNAKRASKSFVTLKHSSKFLQGVLAIGKLRGYIADYKTTSEGLVVEIGTVHKCRAVKPRYVVKVKDIDKYMRRYLPAKGMGILIISTNKGLVTHQTALENGIGGSIIAYFY